VRSALFETRVGRISPSFCCHPILFLNSPCAHRGRDLAPESSRALASESIPKRISRVLDAARIRDEFRKRKALELEGGDNGPAAKKHRGSIAAGGSCREPRGKTSKGKKTANDKGKDETPRIQPGESLAHFNRYVFVGLIHVISLILPRLRRVEDNMRPLVRSAISSASSHARRTVKSDLQSDTASTLPSSMKPKRKHPVSDSDSSDSDKVPPARARATEFETARSSAPRRLNDIAQAPPSFTRLPKERGSAAALARLKGEKRGISKAEGVISMVQRARMEEERERAVKRYRELKAAKNREREDADG
jgi:hypothetical protein